MRLTIFLFSIVSIINILQGSTDSNQHESTDKDQLIHVEDVEFLSKLWPRFVKVKQPFEIPGTKTIVKTQTRGVLMRVEGKQAVIDLGRNGTHRIPLEKTDLISGMQAILNDEKSKRAGSFQVNMFNKFFKLEDGKFIQSRKADIYIFDYFLIFYADLKTSESEAVVSWFLQNKEILENLSCLPLLMPMDSTEEELLGDMQDLEWVFPSVYHWTYEGHKKSFSHDPTPNPSIILIDGNGRIISRGLDVDFLDAVVDLIGKDKKKVSKIWKKYKLDKE